MVENSKRRRYRHKNPPKKKDIEKGLYDPDFILESYISLYLGHSTNATNRNEGSSGGVATELLSSLLESGKVDGVIGVGMKENEPTEAIYKFCATKSEIENLRGSKYCFMDFSDLTSILETVKEKRLALITQPCYIDTIRVWQRTRFTNIIYILSFFCGYNMDNDATLYLVKKAGMEPANVASISYRAGEYPGGFQVTSKQGKKVLFGKECYEPLNLMFLRKGCSKCPYYMGEGADIVLGDAWLKRHKKLSVIITRTEKGEEVKDTAVNIGRIKLYELTEKQLVQMHWHNIKYKKYGHGFLLKVLILLMNRIIPRGLIPFKVLSKLSYYRRKAKVGIEISKLIPVTTNE